MKKILFILAISIGTYYVNAQEALTLYNMEGLNQSIQYNPSFIPSNKWYMGIPGLSSTSVLFTNSGFTWRDLHHRNADDSMTLDVENAINKLKDKNFISFSVRSNIIEGGFFVKKNFISFNVSEKANFNLIFPRELFELLFYGNGAFIGQEVDLRRMGFDATHYREYAIGWARELNKKVTLGTRLKYLYGMENYSSAKTDLNFYTSPDDYTLELHSDYVINTSGTSNDTTGNSGNYVFGLKNTGLGADISATYRYNDRWKINASIIDIGYINWKSNVKNIVAVSGDYTFRGIDINAFLSDDSTSSFESVTDSISDAFTPDETYESYKSWLPAHIYMNVSYRIDQRMTASGLIHAQCFRNTVQPTFTAALNRKVSNHFTASLSYSMINHHLNNLGVGFGVNAGALQFYMITDNIIGTISPLNNHLTHVQFGFNLIFGRPVYKKLTTDYGVQNKSLAPIDAGQVPDNTNTKED